MGYLILAGICYGIGRQRTAAAAATGLGALAPSRN
jgi:hypothetical protein